MKPEKIIVILLFFLFPGGFWAHANTASWWPEQKRPSTIVKVRPKNLAERNLAQSLSGIAAKSVNEGIADVLVWTNVSGAAYNYYLKKLLDRTGIGDLGFKGIWDVAADFKAKNLITGYVLYTSGADNYSIHAGTIQASLNRALLVDESLESQAKSIGLQMCYDARGMKKESDYNASWFDSVKDRLNNRMIVTIAPDDYRQRDMAIAHNCMVYWGVDGFYRSVLNWLKPNSPIVGWNDGDEGTHVETATRYGHFTTGATLVNMPVLSAGASEKEVSRVKNVNPRTLDFNGNRHYHSFVMSDGDNMMIQATGLPLLPEYWSNPDILSLPMNWTSCPVNLSRMVPDAWDYIVENTESDSGLMIEFGGGYQYPDLYASARGADAEKIHRQFAGVIDKKMQHTGTRVFGFITRNSVEGEDARKAYQIYADSLTDIVGMIAVQYVPYNGGKGKIFWVKNRDGYPIPVVTAKYQMWAGLDRAGSGNPAEIAAWINDAAVSGIPNRMDFTIVHAWSYFRQDENGEVYDSVKDEPGAQRGVSPAVWAKDRLRDDVKVVSIEELLWRIRMRDYPDETGRAIEKYQDGTVLNREDSGDEDIIIRVADNRLLISGLTKATRVDVFSVDGVCLYSCRGNLPQVVIPYEKEKFLIVNVLSDTRRTVKKVLALQ